MKLPQALFYLFCLFFLKELNAQNPVQTDFEESQFSIGFIAGTNQTRFQASSNDGEIEDPFGFNYAMRFAYRYRINATLYLEGGLNLSVQNEKIIPPNEEFDNNLNGIFRGLFFPNARLDVTSGYKLWTNSKTAFNLIAGFGITRFADFSVVSQFITQSTNFSATYARKNKLIPFANLGTEFTLKNQRNDEFGFRILYNYGSSSFFDGTYALWKNYEYSEGTFSSFLRGVNVGINYTFTRSFKKERLSNIMKNSEMSKNAAKKQLIFEKRSINPKRQFLTIRSGIGKIQNSFATESESMSRRRSFTAVSSVSYERGWKNNIFLEFDYNFMSFRHGFRVEYDSNSFIELGGEGFASHFLNAGIQYKLQNPKTNFQFVNVHAGLGFGYQFKNKGDQLYEGAGFVTNNFASNYNSHSTVRGNAMPILYTGISKDFRITEKFLLNLVYKHQFGFNSVYITDYFYSSSNTEGIQKATSRINGSVIFLQFGCKYRIK